MSMKECPVFLHSAELEEVRSSNPDLTKLEKYFEPRDKVCRHVLPRLSHYPEERAKAKNEVGEHLPSQLEARERAASHFRR